jgi:hypothetical protein
MGFGNPVVCEMASTSSQLREMTIQQLQAGPGMSQNRATTGRNP